MKLESYFQRSLEQIGIKINGQNPWDIRVHDDRLYKRVLSEGTLGLGEAYMEGWWDCEKLDELVARVMKANVGELVDKNSSFLHRLFSVLFNAQSRQRSKKVAETHYNLGNDLFEKMLDQNMQYTCGYWKNSRNLDQAQIAKLDLICQKLQLKPGVALLDIGCGWGNLVNFAAENYGAKVTGITISKEQLAYCKSNYKNKNLQFLFRDYREVADMAEQFDRVIVVGMVEHVGYKNYRKFMKIVNSVLKDDGLFLLQTIGGNKSVVAGDPWLNKYIFPGGMLPSIKQLAEASEGLFVMEDWHNFGSDYDQTLLAWMENFDKNWSNLKGKYDERFYRMWRYYLLTCSGVFRARENQLWQIVFSKKGVPEGYQAPR